MKVESFEGNEKLIVVVLIMIPWLLFVMYVGLLRSSKALLVRYGPHRWREALLLLQSKHLVLMNMFTSLNYLHKASEGL